jgi:hypothetical protein
VTDVAKRRRQELVVCRAALPFEGLIYARSGVAVELADGAVALPRLEPATRRTVILLGHEWHGIPEEQVRPQTCASRLR